MTDQEGVFPVPSGQKVTLQDVFWDEGEGLTLRVRFLAPDIARNAGGVDREAAGNDMRYLCETFVLPQIAQGADQPAEVILSLSDIAVEFGESNPEATQFFEAYRIEGGNCISESY